MKINVNPFTINWLILYLISWVSSISLCLVIELKIDCFQSRISPEKALSYLSHYGYFSPISTKNLSLFDSFSESLRNFQNFFGLRQSGLLDSGTQEFMKKPRKVIIFNISFTSSRNNIIVSERPLDFPMNYWIRLRHFNVNLTGSCPNVKHQIENWKYNPQVWSQRPSGCQHGPRPSPGQYEGPWLSSVNITGLISSHLQTAVQYYISNSTISASSQLWDILCPEGWLAVAPHLQTTASQERLWVWQFLSPGHNGYLCWRSWRNIWAGILASQQV